MSNTERDTVDTVEKHLAERRKISGWLSALEAKRGETSATVYQRVHDDYVAKLDKVQAKLLAASDAVQVAAADLAARLTDKEESVAHKRDERSEAELRAAVGEFSEREWEKRRTRLDEELATVTAERDTLRDELGRLRAVLDDVMGVAAVERAEEPPLVAAAEGAVVETDAQAPAAGGVASQAPVEEPITNPLGNLAYDAIPVEAAPPGIQIYEQSSAAPVEPAQPLAPSFDELEFLKSVVGRPTPAATRSVSEPPPADQKESSKASGDLKNPYEVPEPPLVFPDSIPEQRVSREITPPRPSFFERPAAQGDEVGKSLRCQECGTMNFPTEWYCERCGGELAAF